MVEPNVEERSDVQYQGETNRNEVPASKSDVNIKMRICSPGGDVDTLSYLAPELHIRLQTDPSAFMQVTNSEGLQQSTMTQTSTVAVQPTAKSLAVSPAG